MTDEITLTGLRVFARHGVYDFERENGQEFVIDVTLRMPLAPAAASDDVADTVHYGELAEALATIAEGEPVNLLETLAERLAEHALADERVQSCRITVHKPQAPIQRTFGDVSVTIERYRDTREAS